MPKRNLKLSINFWLHGLLIFGLLGCFSKDSPIDSSVYDVGNFENSCKIDASRLKKLLEVDVIADINCVENNLKQFTDFVNRPNPEVVRKQELERFINKFFPNEAEQMNKSLSFLFELNTLLLRDQRYIMSVKNLKNIFDLVRLANRYGAPLNQIFKKINDEKQDYWKLRPQIAYLLSKLSKEFLEIIGRAKGGNSSLDVMQFLTEFKKTMELSDEQLDLELIESMLFIKKIFIGGVPRVISTDEVVQIVPKLESGVLLAFDFVHYSDLKLDSKEEQNLFFLHRVKTLKGLIIDWPSDEPIMEHDELVNVLEEFMESKLEFKIKDIEEAIVNIKRKIITGDPEVYTFGELMSVLDWGQELLEQFYFNAVTYQHFKEVMESRGPIKDLVRPELPQYSEFSRSRVFDLWNEFKTITTTYRAFHAPEYIQYYSDDYIRYIEGVNLQSILRFAFRKALNAYGHGKIDPATGKVMFMAATINELRNLLLDLKSVMVELKLWPRFFERFLSEAMNSSDLFQFQADGDGVIRLEEATEYVANIVSSKNLAEDMFEALKAHCDVISEEDRSFETKCYRENFFNTLFKDLNYKKYFPKLYNYTTFFPRAEIQDFLVKVESFAKEIRDPNEPMTIVDIGRLIVSLSNIEMTFMRYDLNKNNLLDRDEIEQGWLVFKKTIIGFANLKPSQESLGKSIYLFIVKKMRPPKTAEALLFHLLGNKKKITARRLNIGSILALVAEATIPK